MAGLLIPSRYNTPVVPSGTNVVFLVPFDGTNGSTNIIDASRAGLTLTANSGAQIYTPIKKFGTGSGIFNGTSSYISVPSTTALDLFGGTKIFTWSCWVRGNGAGEILMYAGATATMQWSGSNLQWLMFINGANQLEIQFRNGTASPTIINGGTMTYTDFRHVEIGCDGTNIYGFIDGTLVFTGSASTAASSTSTPSGEIGRLGSLGFHFRNYLDDLVILKGECRHTTSFTPPTAPEPIP